MKTNDLITLLSQSPPPKKPPAFSVVLFAFLIAVTLFTTVVLGLRPDLAARQADITALQKAVLLGVVAWIAGTLLRDSAKPLSSQRGLIAYLWLPLVLYGGSIVFEVSVKSSSEIMASFYKPNFPECVFFVSLYGAIGSWVLVWLMGFYAPQDYKKAGMMIGLAAAATGAVGYSLHCPIDSPIFITVAYGLPILLLAVVMRKLAEQFIRW